MIKSEHHWFFNPIITSYSKWIIKRNFHNVEVHSNFSDRKLPVLLIVNHFSWWDGFFIAYLNSKLFNRKMHIMMLEEQLKKYFLFKKAGVYSIKKKSKSIIESLNYTVSLLKNSSNLVAMFPQGKLESIYVNKIKFEKGIGKIIAPLNEFHIVFAANLIEYFSQKKPTWFCYIEEYIGLEKKYEILEKSYNSFLQHCQNKQLKIEF